MKYLALILCLFAQPLWAGESLYELKKPENAPQYNCVFVYLKWEITPTIASSLAKGSQAMIDSAFCYNHVYIKKGVSVGEFLKFVLTHGAEKDWLCAGIKNPEAYCKLYNSNGELKLGWRGGLKDKADLLEDEKFRRAIFENGDTICFHPYSDFIDNRAMLSLIKYPKSLGDMRRKLPSGGVVYVQSVDIPPAALDELKAALNSDYHTVFCGFFYAYVSKGASLKDFLHALKDFGGLIEYQMETSKEIFLGKFEKFNSRIKLPKGVSGSLENLPEMSVDSIDFLYLLPNKIMR